MSYKRRRKGYGGTRTIAMRFQSFMDISTSPDSMQVITVSAGGPEVLRRLSPQFSAYKYYKLGSISVKLVPASTLPVDPTGLSYEAGEPGVDPRDQLTPGLMRITNGEDVFENITGLTDAEQHAIYNNMLLDPRWYKWMLQAGVKRYATPRYWQIGQLHQDKWPGATINVPEYDSDGDIAGTTATLLGQIPGSSPTMLGGDNGKSSPMGFFQTGHTGRLGWLPTDGLSRTWNGTSWVNSPLMASPPEVECFKILLPKAYKTRYYYRMFITESVLFREPIVNFGILDGGVAYRPLDVFHIPSSPVPRLPSDAVSLTFPSDPETGGNYGDD